MRLENLSPTPFAELNAVLAELVGKLRTLLGDNLLGAYLQGSFAALRSEVREGLTQFATPWLNDPAKMDRYWLQAFFVVLYCRMLHTLETGEVASKKAGTVWARTNLDSRWHTLIERAWNQRFAPLASWSEPANGLEVAETLAFMHYATELAHDG